MIERKPPESLPRLALLMLAILFALCSASFAELPQIRLDRVFPLGGESGSELTLTIEGKDLDEVKSLHFDRPGFHADLVKPNEFKLKIDADVAPGVYDVRAVGRFGISGARLFAVSKGLAEIAEKEPNDTTEQAQNVRVNAAVNGRSDNNGDDYFRFTATKGKRLTIDCQAYRLDSTLRAVMVLSTAAGKVLMQSRPYYSRTDPLLDVVVPDDGDYVLSLHDMTYSGGHPYRVVISDKPQIENALPIAVTPGETVELTVFGRNLPGGKPVSDAAVLGLPLDQLTVPLNVPGDAASAGTFSQIYPLPSPSINARGVQLRPPGLEDALNPVSLIVTQVPVTRENEPNDSRDTAQALETPTVVAGRLDRPGDSDWFRVDAKRGQAFAIDLCCERIDLPGDLRVVVTNDKGNELANIDDHGINFNSLALNNRDPVGMFTAPADGTYRLLVQDTYRNGGARYPYALRVTAPQPDFYPVVFHETPSDPSCPVVGQGGSAFVEFCVNRRDGFQGAVTVDAEGLPTGVSCPPVHVSPQTEFAAIVLTAAKDAAEWSGPIRLNAWATIDGKRVEHKARCSQRRWAIGNINTSRECREICLAVRSTAPYALKTQPEPVTVSVGGVFETKVRVERQWPDFKGKIQLNGLDLPPGFSVPATDFAEGKDDVLMKISVAGNVPAGTYTVNVRGDAQVPYDRNPKAASRPNVRVADPATPLTVVVTAPVKK